MCLRVFIGLLIMNEKFILKCKNNMAPINYYPSMDGNITMANSDGKEFITTPKPRYTLSSVFPNLEVQNQVMEILRKDREEKIEYHKKARFSSYLDVSAEEIGQWSWDQIDERILEQLNSSRGVQKLFCKSKRIKFVKNNK